MIALPRKIDESNMFSALANKILFASMPLAIDEATAQGRMRRTIDACADLKSKPYMSGLIGFSNIMTSIIPHGVLRKAAGEVWSKHTFQVTNVPATDVEMTLPGEAGEPVKEISLVIANVMPQMSIITYNGMVYASLVADPSIIPDAAKLGQLWDAEFDVLAAAEP